MKSRFKRILTGILASTVLASAASTGVSAAVGNDNSEAADQTLLMNETVETPAAEEAPDSEKVGELPTIGYKHTVYTLDDYILALKRTYRTSKELKSALNAAENYVPYVDNSKSKYFPQIGDQNPIGSCVAWSCVYYQFTNAINKMLDRAATPETNFQPQFIHNIYWGPGAPRFIENLLYTTGCAPWSLVPDRLNETSWNASYEIWREAANYRMVDYICFPTVGTKGIEITSPDDPDLDAVKAALRDGDVLSYAGPIYAYKKDNVVAAPGVDDSIVGDEIVYKGSGNGSPTHMMTIVGYNDNIWTDINKNGKVDKGELGALKIANSWGTGCHTKGFFWIAYDALNKTSCVEGVSPDSERCLTVWGPVKWVVTDSFHTSKIFLEYTLNSDNRTDSYVEVTAKRISDGTVFTRKVNPYQYADFTKTNSQKLNYNGEKGFCDGSMVSDLNNIFPDLDSNKFNDYIWSVRFVDLGTDSSATTVKEAMIVDENTGKTYELDTQFPFSLNKSEKTASLKKYYNFSKLYVADSSNLQVGSAVKFTFKTANETFGSTPIKYTMTVTQDGKQVFSKQHRATTINKSNGYSIIKGSWVPTKTGKYTVTITGTDASGQTAKRSAEFTVYNKKLAVRSIKIDKGKYVEICEKIKITPEVTGGKAPYTYSYYYIKGGKTIKLAENSKSTYKTKTFGTNSGAYKFLVKVKDADGNVAQATQYVAVTPVSISRFTYDLETFMPGKSIRIGSEINYLSSSLSGVQYSYSVEKDGKTVALGSTGNTAVWTPTESGEYNVALKLICNGKILAQKTDKVQVGSNQQAGKKLINVNVITYVYNETNGKNFTLHYWGGSDGAKDVACTALNTTKTKNVGLWSSAQKFYQYTAYIPDDATGFKFHIGNRWFPASGGDGNAKTQNTVYVYNYDYDRCTYTNE